MSHFDPLVTLNVICNSLPQRERGAFRKKWNDAVQKRIDSWKSAKSTPSGHQMEFAAHVCQYVKFTYSKVFANGKCDPNLPLYGPRFLPPSPSVLYRNPLSCSQILTRDFYLKPVTIIHELYWPSLLQCPTCTKAKRPEPNLQRQGFTSEGPRTVHGIKEEEYVIGTKIRCQTCASLKEDRIQWSFTSPEFWSSRTYWEIPCEVPHFLHRSAISRDLFNLINEFRLSVPADRLREHIFQLHLLEYHQRRLQYFKLLAKKIGLAARTPNQQLGLGTFFATSAIIKPFSDPSDPEGYNLTTISDEVITSVYKHFAGTRTLDSEQLIRGITCKVLSFDATYKVTKKATISTGSGTRDKAFQTMVTMITEDNLIASWRFTFTELLLEVQAQLLDLRKRFEALGVPLPPQVIVDNCCTVRNKIEEVLPGTKVGQDIFHISMRYTRAVKPTYAQRIPAIGQEIVSALLSATAAVSPNGRAKYRKRDEQATLMEQCFRKWRTIGAFAPAADNVHDMTMQHIWKGCLERCVDDVRSDGSRIENANRGWNGIARAIPGGLEGFLLQAHDWVLRRNIRIAFGSKTETSISPFVGTTFGSHHTSLVSEGTKLWNEIVQTKQLSYPLLPLLKFAAVDEHFGLVTPIDGTFDIKSTADIDYAGFEETLLLEEAAALQHATKLEVDDDPDPLADSRNRIENRISSPEGAPGSSANNEPQKRPRSPSNLQADFDSAARSGKRRRHIVPSAEPEFQDESLMELLPDGQDLSEFLQSEDQVAPATAVSGSVSQRFHPAMPGPSRSPTSASRVVLPELKKQHPYFNQFPSPANQNPFASRSSTPLVTPRVLPRPPAGTTRQPRSRSTSSRLAIQPMGGNFEDVTVRGQPPSLNQAITPAKFLADHMPCPPMPSSHASLSTGQPTIVPEHPRTPPPLASNQPASSAVLSPTQQTFEQLTRLDPRALKFQDNDFFVMMELREKWRWDSRKMSMSDWMQAVQVFNEKRQQNRPSKPMVPIQNKVFQEEFLKVEKTISQRLLENNFRSATSGTETFWRRHCYAVPGFEPAAPPTTRATPGAGPSRVPILSAREVKQKVTLKKDGSERKEQVCQRCRCAKYPGGQTNKQINHKRSECNDGVNSSLNKFVPYPFPSGVIKGKKLDIDALRRKCSTIRPKQVEQQPLSIEEENLLNFYSQNVYEGPDNVTYLAVGKLVVPSSCSLIYFNQQPHIRL
ncbi:hypothetical protein M407DRAFT_26496 [Tulasnella calospora MUT 4182]|uniref:Uncharacterized protein n=1 Tax=Tulasnella calospora MUT 4182 TaxID=1051891 RepID=A0A0C3QFJ7_9AGAM|nr:hypothetical protein M407DRAFT_26496 [Tulasnella calospora MUT 4182]